MLWGEKIPKGVFGGTEASLPTFIADFIEDVIHVTLTPTLNPDLRGVWGARRCRLTNAETASIELGGRRGNPTRTYRNPKPNPNPKPKPNPNPNPNPLHVGTSRCDLDHQDGARRNLDTPEGYDFCQGLGSGLGLRSWLRILFRLCL